MVIGDPARYIYLDVINGFEIYVSAIAGLSFLLIVRAVWRTISGG
jgi:hypothetical protein